MPCEVCSSARLKVGDLCGSCYEMARRWASGGLKELDKRQARIERQIRTLRVATRLLQARRAKMTGVRHVDTAT